MDIKHIITDLNIEFKKDKIDKKAVITGINAILNSYNQISSVLKKYQNDLKKDNENFDFFKIENEENMFKKKITGLRELIDFLKNMDSVLSIDKIISKIEEAIVSHLLIDTINIFLYEHEKKGFSCIRAKGTDEFQNGYFISETDPFVEDLKKYNTCISKKSFEVFSMTGILKEKIFLSNIQFIVPLIEESQLLGMLFLGERVGGSPLTEMNLEFINSFSVFVAIAIKNAKIHKSCEDKIKQFEILHQFCESVIEKDDKNSIFEQVLDVLTSNFDVKKCSIVLYDEMKNSFHVEKNLNLSESQSETYLRILLETSDVITTRKIYHIDEAKGLDPGDILLCIPLVKNSVLIGLLNIYSFNNEYHHTEDISDLLSIIASQFSFSLALNKIVDGNEYLFKNPFDYVRQWVEYHINRVGSTGKGFSIIRIIINAKKIFYSALIDLGSKIKTILPLDCSLKHVGYNEMIIIQSGTTSKKNVEHFIKAAFNSVSSLKSSVKVVIYPDDGENTDTLIRKLYYD